MDSVKRKFGWIPDVPDHRDFRCLAVEKRPKEEFVDLRNSMPEIYDQLEIGSCTANGVGSLLQHVSIKERMPFYKDVPSRLFLYYFTRELEGTINEDCGAMIRNAIKIANSFGACAENPTWPYVTEKFKTRPNHAAIKEAERQQAIEYRRVQQTPAAIENCLVCGYPIVFGSMLYESFNEITKNGIAKYPSIEECPIGGHCMVMVGYDRRENLFIVRNSWGEKWGNDGHCYMPYKYILNNDLTDDLWTIREVG